MRKEERLEAVVWFHVVMLGFSSFAVAKYGGGSGTADDPYLICTAEQLNTIGTDANDWRWYQHFRLMADIDLQGYTDTQFNIIGWWWNGKEEKPFRGTFDGNGKAISNFRYTSSGSSLVAPNNLGVGIFGCLKSATVRDLRLVDPNVDTPQRGYVGVLAGHAYDSTIVRCSVEGGRVIGGGDVGALIGCSSSDITDCNSSCCVTGKYVIGGLVGHNGGSITSCHVTGSVDGEVYAGGVAGDNTGEITQCVSDCDVTGRAVGGLVGHNNSSGEITLCRSAGTIQGEYTAGGLVGSNYIGGKITSCGSTALVKSAGTYAGGLVGYSSGPITACFAAGRVEGEEFAAGLVASNGATITHCYSSATVYGKETAVGLAGGSVSCCYSTSRVTGNGQINGFGAGGSPYLCYWDTQASGVATSSGGKGRTTSQMRDAATFRGWGQGNQWVLDEGRDYPRLAWEDTPGEALVDQARLYGGGTGTADDPYRIETAEQLVDIGYFRPDLKSHFVLTRDIDMAGVSPDQFVPIGAAGVPFEGVFDGSGHAIANFRYPADSQQYIGLFAEIGYSGHVLDLHLTDASVSGGAYVGGLAGSCSGRVERCSVCGEIQGTKQVGGLIGCSDGYILASSTGGKVMGDSSVGGLIGYSDGAVSESYSVSDVVGRQGVGGLVGTNGEVQVSAPVQGLPAGFIKPLADAEVKVSYALGAVAGHEDTGGLVGENDGLILACYCAGSVTDSDASSSGSSIGGLVGENDFGTVHLSYWDAQSGGQSDSDGGKARTTEQMMTAATFRGWAGVGQWTIWPTMAYPHLAWEGAPGVPIIDDATRYSSGAGEPNDPYQIYSAAEFIEIGYHPADWDKCFLLCESIDLNAADPNEIWPIGVRGASFTGIFDGMGHSMMGFHLYRDAQVCVGIFGSVDSLDSSSTETCGLITDVDLRAVDISGYACVGGLVGLNEGTISRCSVEGETVAVDNDAGGVAGVNRGVLHLCQFTGTTTGRIVAGGLAGLNEGSILACSTQSDVSASYYAGGLVGQNDYDASIFASFAVAQVSGEYATGGLSGRNGGHVEDCYAVGAVDGKKSVGGLVGVCSGDLARCYSACTVSGQNKVAGLVGESTWNWVAVSSSFWDASVSGLTDGIADKTPDPNGAMGRTTAQMKTQSTFIAAGWDLVGESENGSQDIWSIEEGVDYPRLIQDSISIATDY